MAGLQWEVSVFVSAHGSSAKRVPLYAITDKTSEASKVKSCLTAYSSKLVPTSALRPIHQPALKWLGGRATAIRSLCFTGTQRKWDVGKYSKERWHIEICLISAFPGERSTMVCGINFPYMCTTKIFIEKQAIMKIPILLIFIKSISKHEPSLNENSLDVS